MLNENSEYGKCSNCKTELEPVFFEEEEMKTTYGRPYKTERYRKACSHLVCEFCGHVEAVDDTFDGPWYYK